jgi:hypothetical protein
MPNMTFRLHETTHKSNIASLKAACIVMFMDCAVSDVERDIFCFALFEMFDIQFVICMFIQILNHTTQIQ